jgi:GT2 family glycosyltransferase
MFNSTLPSVAVVILNYNTAHLLAKFLPSVLASNYNNMRVVVADNGSTDNSLEVVKTQFPEVHCIAIGSNLGFTGGYNKVLQEIEADYFVLLNSDVEVSANWLVSMLEEVRNDDKIVAVQPVIRKYGNPTYYEYAGAAGGFIDRYGYPFCRGRLFDTVEETNEKYKESRDVFWASGACLLVKASVFKELGGFDVRFFAHMEEIDLCWRMRHAGYRIVVAADAEVFHMGGGTLSATSPKKTFLNFHNGLAMLAKNLPRKQLCYTLLMRLILDHIAAYRFLFKGKPQHFLAIAKAHALFLWGIKKWLKNPRPDYRLKEQKEVFYGSVVWAYYVGNKKHFYQVMG